MIEPLRQSFQALMDVDPDPSPRSYKKSSLGYILGPSSPERPSTGSTTSTSRPSSSSRDSPLGLLRLPRKIITRIAYLLVLAPTSPESATSNATSHPAALLPLLLTCKSVHSALSLKHNPRLYHDLYLVTFDTGAITRRYEWISRTLERQSGGKKKAFDLFGDPKSFAQDYKSRWASRGRMRRAVRDGTLEVEAGKKTDIMPDLWMIWFLVTEDDGKNMPFLKEQCLFQEWTTLYYEERLLKEAQEPGYPTASADKALALWCMILSGTAMERNLAEVDEKIFMLRPMVFACSQYDISFAPWHHRHLPLCQPGCTCSEHTAALGPQLNAVPYERFGYTWRRAPPHFVPGSYLLFFRLLERQAVHFAPQAIHPPFLFGSKQTTPSMLHDREWQRNSVCQDPHVSAGLPNLAFRGAIEGKWKGQFLFYPLEAYREVVAGNMRAVYTAEFGAQGMEMDLKETVVKVRIGEEGGDGNWVVGGFKEYDDEEGEKEGENAEQRRVKEGYGHEVVTDFEAEDEEGWTKEILISGRSKSNWGCARIRGRIRAWDGLVILVMNYEQNPRHPMGRWLWRGYLHTGDNLLGRWRDTFTPGNSQGHEGALGLVRIRDTTEVESPKEPVLDHQGDLEMGDCA